MPPKRETALADLKRLAEELRNSKVVSCDRTLANDFGKICTSASNDGSKSWLPEINKWIEAINSKVREQLILS